MAGLPSPPFELDAEPLVTGSVEISNDRLVQGFSWLVASVQEQNRMLNTLSSQVDRLKAGAASAEPHSQDGTRPSMKEEMLLMQINAIKHEVSSLPRSSDLERQRERTMAEVQSISSNLGDRQRESAERLQKELADVTDSLCNQLKRIGDDVFSRLESLEQRQVPQRAAAAQPQPASQPQPPQAQSSIPPPLPNPMSSSSIAAEDTEDHTDGLLMSDGVAAATGNRVAADLAALDARITGRLDAAERQLEELRNQLRQQQVVCQSLTDQVQARQAASETSQAPAAAAASSAQAPAESPAPSSSASVPTSTEATKPSPDTAFLTDLGPPELAATGAVATAVPTAVATNSPEEPSRQSDSAQDTSAFHSAALAAAAEAATQAVTEIMQKDQGHYTLLQEEMLDLRSKLDMLSQSVASGVPVAAETPAQQLQAPAHQAEQAPPPQSQEAVSETLDMHTGSSVQEDFKAGLATLTSVQQRVSAVEEAVKQVEGAFPQLQTVPLLEVAIQRMQHSLDTLAQPSQPQPQFSPSDAKAVTETPEKSKKLQSELPEPAPEEAERNKDIMMLSDEQIERLMSRLQDMEELQERAEKRILQLESRSREVRSRSGSISLDRKQPTSRSTTSKTSEPPSGSTVGGSWKDVQAELERFRKLFEFIEGVLPQDAAEAMRFFNRREVGKVELSEMVSDVFGADIEFQNAKSQLESDFKMHTRELRREFDKLTLALKVLQRDVDTSGSKVVDLTRRTSQLESEVRVSPAVATSSMEDPHQEPSPRGPTAGRRDSKDTRDKALQGMSQELQGAIQELRDEIRHWIELFKASVVQALQNKPDHEQVAEFVKQVIGAGGEQVALFAKRQLLGKCASCEAPIDVDLMRVKRPQPIGMPEHWPPGESIGAKVAIRPLHAGPVSPSGSIARLPKINNRDNKAKGMKSSASTPELRKEEPPSADIA